MLWLLPLLAPAHAGVVAVLVNGGAEPWQNYASHDAHLRAVDAALAGRGVDRIDVFRSDGPDPAPDLAIRLPVAQPGAHWLEGTAAARLLPPDQLVDSTWDRPTRPATPEALASWFALEGAELEAGDTLLLYVTDHGQRGDATPLSAAISLWGSALSVAELGALLDTLDDGVRVVLSMSQCFSGAFADLVVDDTGGLVGADRCGFFAAPAHRSSYGCTAMSASDDRGHGFRWAEALPSARSLEEAHARVAERDRTPDVPLSTVDVWAERALRSDARALGVHLDERVDEVLAGLGSDAVWDEVAALVAPVGLAAPTGAVEATAQVQQLARARRDAELLAARWATLAAVERVAAVDAFLVDERRWQRRLLHLPAPDGADPRSELRSRFLAELTPWLDARTEHGVDAARRAGRSRALQALAWRLSVREAVVLRARGALRLRAAEASAHGARAVDLGRLQACEAWAPGERTAEALPPATSLDWPPLSTDTAALEAARPGALGASWRPPSEDLRRSWALPDGAMVLLDVRSGGAAERSDLQPGDVLVGTPDAPFQAPSDALRWTLEAPPGVPTPLLVARDARTYEAQVALTPMDQVQDVGPRLARPVRLSSLGAGPVEVGRGADLLFFWATWCAPCKDALPEVRRFAGDRGLRVVAVTSEDPAVVRRWLHRTPSELGVIALDPDRELHAQHDVWSVPTFLHVEGASVRARQEGYSRARGLFR